MNRMHTSFIHDCPANPDIQSMYVPNYYRARTQCSHCQYHLRRNEDGVVVVDREPQTQLQFMMGAIFGIALMCGVVAIGCWLPKT